MCFCYDFRHTNQNDDDGKTKVDGNDSNGNDDQDYGLQEILQALVDSDANPDAIRVGAKGAVVSSQNQLQQTRERKQLESRERQQQQKSQEADETNGNSSATNNKKFKRQVQEIKTIRTLVQDGCLSEKLAEQKIQKILGVKSNNPECNKDGTAIVYPLGGCCNYAPCLFPDGCCPDGWYVKTLYFYYY